ncbi:hypothetical protein ACVWYN_002809 [Pedobacter sp. UYP24]
MKTTKVTIILLLAITAFFGCKKRNSMIQTATVQVTVQYPTTYSQSGAANTEVKLVSKTDGATLTAVTNSSGVATLNDVIPGTYNITTTKSITATEALTLTGVSRAIQLNAAENDVNVGTVANVTLKLAGSAAGSLLIKEVYYNGSRTLTGGTYFSDQFVEIYNNSTDVIYLDGLYIADLYGNSGLINPTSDATPYKNDKDNSYASNVWRIPGTGKQYPLAVGSSIIIAQDGVNHQEATLNPNSPVDLSKADFETYNERPDNRDADAPSVPNLEKTYFTGGFDWLLTVFGPGLVIFRADDFTKLEKVAIPGSTQDPRIKIPNALVIDAFEALKDANSAGYKRVPVALDAGFVFAADTYNMESFRRKVSTTINGRVVLQDTNNSGNDFVKIAKPTPKKFN